MTMQSGFPYGLQWTSEQIADAVPLRLFVLFAFDANAEAARPAVNAPLHRPWRHYPRPAALPAFVRVHS